MDLGNQEAPGDAASAMETEIKVQHFPNLNKEAAGIAAVDVAFVPVL